MTQDQSAIDAPTVASRTQRIAAIDVVRGIAVVGMFGYHLTWDLADFGYIDARAPFAPAFRLYSHIVACTFLVLAGISLVLARRTPMRWRRWARHLAAIVLAAGAVTVASALFFPAGLITFGILHCIAAALLVATPFLFLPPLAAVAAAAVIAALPWLVGSPVFDVPGLIWTGLGTIEPASNDYRPFFPWAAPVLLGLGAAGTGVGRDGLARLSGWRPADAAARTLAWGGRHSLAIYLLHQPLFFAMLKVATLIAPPLGNAADAAFTRPCELQCRTSGAADDLCRSACACTAREVRTLNLWDKFLAKALDDGERAVLSHVAQDCVRGAAMR